MRFSRGLHSLRNPLAACPLSLPSTHNALSLPPRPDAGLARVAAAALAAAATATAFAFATVMVQATKVLKILCLHGKGGCSSSFRPSLAPLVDALGPSVVFDIVDAPHELGPSTSRAWWLLPPGERRFTAPTYEGDEVAIEAISAAWRERGPYDGVLGFSQGAMLAAIITARGALDQGPLPRFALMFGAATPKPYEPLLAALSEQGCAVPTLHSVSASDRINPATMGEWVAGCFAPSAEVLHHDAAHAVPQDAASVETVRAFVAQFVDV